MAAHPGSRRSDALGSPSYHQGPAPVCKSFARDRGDGNCRAPLDGRPAAFARGVSKVVALCLGADKNCSYSLAAQDAGTAATDCSMGKQRRANVKKRMSAIVWRDGLLFRMGRYADGHSLLGSFRAMLPVRTCRFGASGRVANNG